jgi:hypothetical protein
MSPAHLLWNYLWIAPHVLQVAVVCIMLRRGFHKRFPLFFLYTIYEIFEFLVLFPMYHISSIVNGPIYRYTDFTLSGGGALLGFGVTYEIFVYTSHSYKLLSHRGKTVLGGTILVLFALVILLAKNSHPGHIGTARFIGTLLDSSVVFLQCGLLVGLLSFSRLLHLEWQRPAFGIALGLAIYASAELILSAINSRIGYYYPLDYAYMGTYHVCALVWLYYMTVPEKTSSLESVPGHDELEVWSQVIGRLLQN